MMAAMLINIRKGSVIISQMPLTFNEVVFFVKVTGSDTALLTAPMMILVQ
jgi:hypothetical protein